MGARLVVIGDALLDRDVEGSADRLAPDAPVPVLEERGGVARPGGAALAASMLAADGHRVTLVCALGDDVAGRELATLVAGHGVTLLDLGLAGATPEKIRLCAGGRPLLRLDRGATPSPPGRFPAAAAEALAEADAVLVADYGRGIAADPAMRDALPLPPQRRVPVVWDPHPRGTVPPPGVTLATPNRPEAASMSGASGGGGNGGASGANGGGNGGGLSDAVAHARALLARWRARGIAVTLGADGAVFVDGDGPPLAVPAEAVLAPTADTCGAGDRFATAALGALAAGALPSEAVVQAVEAATAFVSDRGTAGSRRDRPADVTPEPSPAGDVNAHALGLARRTRGAGGTVVTTGGCFDLLHAGHVSLLRTARQLGDCLIVCLNSDASVRRLKGPGRPLVPQTDRAAVLLALDCVDAVAIFDEDTPDALLGQLRPHLFAKGGDYAGSRISESETVARWGGQAIVLPYLVGRSTTGLLRRARSE